MLHVSFGYKELDKWERYRIVHRFEDFWSIEDAKEDQEVLKF